MAELRENVCRVCDERQADRLLLLMLAYRFCDVTEPTISEILAAL